MTGMINEATVLCSLSVSLRKFINLFQIPDKKKRKSSEEGLSQEEIERISEAVRKDILGIEMMRANEQGQV